MPTVAGPTLTTEMLDQLGDAVTMVNSEWVYTYVSPGAAQIIGVPADQVIGQVAWDIFPEVVGTPEHAAMMRAMTLRLPERIVWFFDTVNRWYEQQAIPAGDGLMIVVNDVTDSQTVVRRSSQLLEVGESLAQGLTVDDVARVVREHVLPLVGATAGGVVLVDEPRGMARSLGWVGMPPEVTDGMRVFPLEPPTPSVDAYATGRPIMLAGYDEIRARYPQLVEFARAVDKQSIIAFPLTAAEARVGSLVLLFDSERAFDVLDSELIATIAAMIAQALSRAQLYDGAQRSTRALQRSLLPLQLPVIDGLDIAVRYAASEETLEVGGDWFDVVSLPAGAVGIVMGDVEGHDLAAAALMGLMRSAIRAYAIEEHPPAVIMRRANEFLAGLGSGRLVTVSYSQMHPAEGLITTVSAGHLPAMITSPAGGIRDVPSEIGPPLGVVADGLLWPETTSTLPQEAVVMLFTDGLVETRTDDISVGLDRVREVLESARADAVEDIADAVLGSRRPGTDDVALVVARVTVHVDDNRIISRRLPPTPASVALARRFVRQLLSEWQVAAGTAADVELALSEIVTNAARHSEDTLDLRLSCDTGCVRFAVSDSSHRMPGVMSGVGDDATSGRGLNMVDSLASRWGIESDGLGNTVWCEFDR